MIENQIGKRFAEALSDSIPDEGRLEQALSSLKGMAGAFEAEPNLTRFFQHPSIAIDKKAAMGRDLCEKTGASEIIKNLVDILVERQKMGYLKNIADYFEKYVSDRLNQVRVEVSSAYPLTDKQVDHLKSSLDRILGKRAIIEAHVDESLIGGIRLSVGSLVADASIKNRLSLLRRSMEKEEVFSEFAS